MKNKSLIVIEGPTCVGKTALSIAIAKHYHTEIISSDSRQFFRELSIGTAKPSKEEMQHIPHHFIDNCSIQDEYNVGIYETEALKKITELFSKKDTLLLVGGSGLYIDAICKGFDELPEADAAIRAELDTTFKEKGIKALQELLLKYDPAYYKTCDVSNPRRLMRAIEVSMISGKPYSSLRSGEKKKRDFNTIKIGLDMDRKNLYEKINERMDDMMQKGLEQEARSVYAYKNHNALKTVGYKELFAYFEKAYTLPRAIELIKQNTRNFSKRQLTWFRRDKEIKWFSPEQEKEIIRLTDSL